MVRVVEKWADVLFMLSVICFGFFDGVSTFVVLKFYPIAIIYETSALLRWIYFYLDVYGVLFGKVILVTLLLSLNYYLICRRCKWQYMGIGIMIGAISAGLISGASNLFVFARGYSLFLIGLNAQQIGLLLIIGLPAIGLFADLYGIKKSAWVENYD
jgi:hypothetical protein